MKITQKMSQRRYQSKNTQTKIPKIKSVHLLGNFYNSKPIKNKLQSNSMKYLENMSQTAQLRSKNYISQCYDSSKKYKKEANQQDFNRQELTERQNQKNYNKTRLDNYQILTNYYTNIPQYEHRKQNPYKAKDNCKHNQKQSDIKNPQRRLQKQAQKAIPYIKDYKKMRHNTEINGFSSSSQLTKSPQFYQNINLSSNHTESTKIKNRQRQHSINLRKRTRSPGYLSPNNHSQSEIDKFIKFNNHAQIQQQKIQNQIKFMHLNINPNSIHPIESTKQFIDIPKTFNSPTKNKLCPEQINDFKRIKSKLIVKKLQDIKTVQTKYDHKDSEEKQKLEQSIIMSKGINLYQNNSKFIAKKLSFQDGQFRWHHIQNQENQLGDLNLVSSTSLSNQENCTSPQKQPNNKNSIVRSKYSSASTKYLLDSHQDQKKISRQIQQGSIQSKRKNSVEGEKMGIDELISTGYIDKNNIRLIYNNMVQSIWQVSENSSINIKRTNILDNFQYNTQQEKFQVEGVNLKNEVQFEQFCGELMIKLSISVFQKITTK